VSRAYWDFTTGEVKSLRDAIRAIAKSSLRRFSDLRTANAGFAKYRLEFRRGRPGIPRCHNAPKKNQ
jgi:hypothetical protein